MNQKNNHPSTTLQHTGTRDIWFYISTMKKFSLEENLSTFVSLLYRLRAIH